MTDIFCCLTRLVPIDLPIFISGGTGFLVFVSREFHTGVVSSAAGVAQLMYMYIREHNDQARAYVAYSSPVTYACRGDIRASALAKN